MNSQLVPQPIALPVRAQGEPPPIALYFSGKVFRVWDADGAALMRNTYRVFGSLVGSLPSQPQQNIVFSLPVVLTHEEAHVLVDVGAAQLFDDTDAYEPILPNTEGDAKRQRIDTSSDAQVAAPATAIVAADETVPPTNVSTAVSALPIPIATNALGRHNHRPRPMTWDEVGFPATPDEALRASVFRDLWERGYYMTSGLKFGGDYLVYPGDPNRYHAHYVAFIQPFRRKLTPLQLVSFGRLATTVKKTFLLCSQDDDGHAEYVSIEWTGMN